MASDGEKNAQEKPKEMKEESTGEPEKQQPEQQQQQPESDRQPEQPESEKQPELERKPEAEDGTEQKRDSGFASQDGVPKKPEKEEKPETRCQKIVRTVWIAAIVLAIMLSLPGTYLTYTGVEQCLPFMTELKQNLKQAWYEDLRIGYFKQDMILADNAANEAIYSCRYMPFPDQTTPYPGFDQWSEIWVEKDCTGELYYQPEELLKDPVQLRINFRHEDESQRANDWASSMTTAWQFGNFTSDITKARNLFFQAYNHSLKRIAKVGNDKYFGASSDSLRAMADAITNITQMFEATTNEDYCSHIHFFGCGILHEVNETLNASYAESAYWWFVDNPVVNTWQDYPTTIRGLHAMPYFLLCSLLLILIALFKKGKGKWKYALIPAAMLWLVAMIFYGIICVVGLQVKYGDVILENFEGKPPASEVLDHVEIEFPLTYKLVFADMEDGLNTLLFAAYYCFAAITLTMGPLFPLVPIVCGCCLDCAGRIMRHSYNSAARASGEIQFPL